MTEKYDFIVFGGGTGNKVASYASKRGNKVALIEPGPLGGTCINRGCNPSKMLIHHADILDTIYNTKKFHIDATVNNVDFGSITEEISETLGEVARRIGVRKKEDPNLDLYKEEGRFTSDFDVRVGREVISGDKVIIAAGSRPFIPPSINGLDKIGYITSSEAMFLNERPEELIILGGGYIAAELGYFFGRMGSNVTIVQRSDHLLSREDREIAKVFTKIFSDRYSVLTGSSVVGAREMKDGFSIKIVNRAGNEDIIEGDEVLVALGRRPNTDLLGLENTGIETDQKGFIKTDSRLETTVNNVWALGDIAGNFMFKHSADYEAKVVIDNAVEGRNRVANYSGVPHAIFANPQIGAVGSTEQELKESETDYIKGYAKFRDIAMSRAQKFEHGFVKVLVSPENGEILGCHILGHKASVLIHEISLAIRNDLTFEEVADSIHVHPTLNKVIEKAFENF